MNKDLLKQLYCIHSRSGQEKRMRRFLKKCVISLGASFEQDPYGNLLVTKGKSDTYPCIAAHIDQVQTRHSEDFTCIEGDDIIIGFSKRSRAQQGLGADDKNGIFIALECLAEFDVLKVVLFVGEEIGCVGSSRVDLKFFNDCRFVIQSDRRNGGDLITHIGCDLCSDEFLKDSNYAAFGFKPTDGLITDVGELKSRGLKISCINFSSGYYEPHTDREFTILSELENSLRFAENIITNCTKVYEYVDMSYKVRFNRFDTKVDFFGSFPTYYTSRRNREEPRSTGYIQNLDKETMREVLEDDPLQSFDQVFNDYSDFFYTTDSEKLRTIYDEVQDEIKKRTFEYPSED